jgi:flagellar biosynthesis protein FlhF
MAEALAAVKRDLGVDAAILHTRSFRRGGMFGFGRRTVVEVTASESQDLAAHQTWIAQRAAKEREVSRVTPGSRRTLTPSIASPRIDLLAAIEEHRRQAERAPARGRANAPAAIVEGKPGAVVVVGAPPPVGMPAEGSGGAPSSAPHPRSISPDSISDAANNKDGGAAPNPIPAVAQRFILTRAPDPAAPSPRPARNRIARANIESAQSPLLEKLAQPVRLKSAEGAVEHSPAHEEMRAIRQMVGEILRHQTIAEKASAAAMAPKLFELYLRLRGQDVAEEIADQLAQRVQAVLSSAELDDADRVRDVLRTELIGLIPVQPTSFEGARLDGRPLTIALIGPTGVGKTTTLAKLAATFKLHHAKRVGLITSDTYRIAAVEQLRTYANIISVPLRIALTPQEMLHGCQQFRECDVILIDTAGRSQRDREKLSELSKFIHAAAPHEVHLVLSTTAGERVLAQEAESFSAVRCDRLIVTKIDEAVSYGPLLSLLRQVQKPLSFITTGQEVPDHLEPASAARIAELILG